MSVVSNALKILDQARAKLDTVGLCPFQVFVRVRTWSGDRVGMGTSSDVVQPITVANGKRPQVELVREKSIVSPGTPLMTATFLVGPLTPEYPGGGVPTSLLSPAGGKNIEVAFIVKGPDLPATGLLCKKTKLDASNPFRLVLTLESLAQAA